MSALKEINKLIAKELSSKPTVKNLEDHAQNCYDYHVRNHSPKELVEFYKGALRAIEILRKQGLLKE